MLERYNFGSRKYLRIADKAKVVLANYDRLIYEILEESEAKGYGNGFEYTAEMAETLLGQPYSSEVNLLSRVGQKYFRSLRNGPRRQFSPVGSKIKERPFWYFQGPEPTCGAWALASVALNMGRPLRPEFMAELLNEANDISFLTTNERLREKLPLSEEPGLDAETVEYLLNRSNQSLRIGMVLHDWPDLDTYPDYVSRVIKNGGSLLESVRAGDFYGLSKVTGIHNIAVIGFDSTPKGVNLQILDSNLGELWVPAESVFSARSGSLSVVRAGR